MYSYQHRLYSNSSPFVDDIIIFYEGNLSFIVKLKETIQSFCTITGMEVNIEKSTVYNWGLMGLENHHISRILGTMAKINNDGMKYLGFTLKVNNYYKNN